MFNVGTANLGRAVRMVRFHRLMILKSKVLLALRCYQKRHGRLPGALEDLVPEYIEKVPVDPYDDMPLRYDPLRKIIYSVGLDLKDQGGVLGDKLDRNEPTFKVESPKGQN